MSISSTSYFSHINFSEAFSLQYINLSKLSFGIRILLELNRENDMNVADHLLKSFCGTVVKIFGTKIAKQKSPLAKTSS